MILTCKRLQVDIFLTRRLSKELAFCEFASVNFVSWVGERGVCRMSEIRLKNGVPPVIECMIRLPQRGISFRIKLRSMKSKDFMS